MKLSPDVKSQRSAGLCLNSFQLMVDNAVKRGRAVAYINAGCPELPEAVLHGVVDVSSLFSSFATVALRRLVAQSWGL